VQKQKLLKRRYNYYEKDYIKYELVKQMKNHEVMFMSLEDYSKTMRGFFITTYNFLNDIFNHYNLFYKLDNIYISLAHYKKIPFFTLDLKKRSKETSEWFEYDAKNQIIGYDLLLDFDCKHKKNYSEMQKEVGEFCNILMINKVCFQVYPSGSNFQIIIPSDCFTTNKNTYIWEYVGYLTKSIKKRFQLKYLDLKGVGVYNKVRKCPYSLVANKVCLPFNSEDILRSIALFDYQNVEIINVLKNIQIAERGSCYYNNFPNKDYYMNKFIWKHFLLEGNQNV
jgi:hypothetical protein